MRTVYLIALLLGVGAAPAAPFAAVPYQDRPVTAKVPPYTVRPDLGNISNRALLPKLTEAQRKALVTNAFVARPTREEQLFYLYEQNNYRNIPSFVTTDSVLHTWHVFYDFTLRWLEQECLLPVVQQLSQGMFDSTAAALKDEHPAEITAALERNQAFFAVPLALLEQRPKLPPTVAALVDRELQKIAAHEKRDQAVTGAVVDYTQFIPRGHYTRSEGLQRFFKAMLWYGLVPLDLKSSPATLQALLITSRLIGNDDLKALWEQLYEPTTFYVGRSDDLTWLDYAPLLVRVFGSGDIDRFADEEKLAAFRALAEKELPGPRIANEMLIDGKEVTQGRQFRLLGQRYIPDSQILQDLTYPKVGTQAEPRHLPMGLDVFAVLGSQRAAELLDKVYQQPKFANYLEQRQKLTAQFAALSPVDWQQNLYHGWLYVLQPLLSPASAGYPAFMRNLAWRDKSLITSLASWTQLRHDTILYGKQSVAEAGGDEPPPPPGYVEPQPLLYERLTWLLRTARQGLLDRGFLTEPKDAEVDIGGQGPPRGIASEDWTERQIEPGSVEPRTGDDRDAQLAQRTARRGPRWFRPPPRVGGQQQPIPGR
ncbi:MAG: DUF3160 domain-containing protein [Armatimonadetes bacterium]|nr:DUF3160 domain-containing protein [Armatimonadota bacterium]